MFRKIAFHLARKWRRQLAVGKGSAAYWNASMVATRPFGSMEDSLEHFHWRNAQYPGYIDLHAGFRARRKGGGGLWMRARQ